MSRINTQLIIGAISVCTGWFLYKYGHREDDSMTVRFGALFAFLGLVGILLPLANALVDWLLDRVL